ncbi:Uncharacterised protein [Bacteroides uniformis]|uniref:Uncharacterized protein n=1 Tax=Bacteroides uniformis TaxID=820 RepID=A0A174U1B2_BACUN|nr:Uncharacterised protein [Bacteroides uniformis]
MKYIHTFTIQFFFHFILIEGIFIMIYNILFRMDFFIFMLFRFGYHSVIKNSNK